MNIQEILDEALGKNTAYLDDRHFSLKESYNQGKIEETVLRIDKKLYDISQDLKSINIILEKLNEK